MYREEQLKALLQGRRILVAGYGREGKSAENLIKKLLPSAPVTIATQVEKGKWKDTADQWHDDWPFDLVIKSPGIPTFHCFPLPQYDPSLAPTGCSPSQGELSTGLRGTPCHVNTPSPLRGTPHQEGESLQGPSGCSPSQGELSEGLRGKQRPDLRQAIRRPIGEWRHLIVNDFEASVFPAHPAIAALKDDFYRRGALYASMTGSGAAVFGIFAR